MYVLYSSLRILKRSNESPKYFTGEFVLNTPHYNIFWIETSGLKGVYRPFYYTIPRKPQRARAHTHTRGLAVWKMTGIPGMSECILLLEWQLVYIYVQVAISPIDDACLQARDVLPLYAKNSTFTVPQKNIGAYFRFGKSRFRVCQYGECVYQDYFYVVICIGIYILRGVLNIRLFYLILTCGMEVLYGNIVMMHDYYYLLY